MLEYLDVLYFYVVFVKKRVFGWRLERGGSTFCSHFYRKYVVSFYGVLICTTLYQEKMAVKLRDAPRIVKHRFAFFRGEVVEAAGKDLLYRIVASEPELTMLEAIESKFEPTTYIPKPGCHVDYLTPEVCRQIYLIFTELGLDKDVAGENAGTRVSGQSTQSHSESAGGRKPKRPRFE